MTTSCARSSPTSSAGLSAALEGDFDLVLLDSMMPKLTGVEVCRRLRDDARTRRVPIVMLTVKSQEADVQRGFAAGADDFVAKPFRRSPSCSSPSRSAMACCCRSPPSPSTS